MRTFIATALLCVFASGAAVNAALITYAPPTINGNTVMYPAVSESSNTDAVPLYGAPQISGDNLLFRNMNFNSNSVNAVPPVDFTDGQINFTLMAKPGNFLSTLTLNEFGDYNVSATPANPAAINFVKAFPQAMQITVLEVNQVPLGVPLVNNTSAVMNYSPSGGDFLTGVDPATGSWTGTAFADLFALFGSREITKITVSFNNQLLAQSQAGGIATISKKGFDIIPGGVIPEPASAALALVGFALTTIRRRR